MLHSAEFVLKSKIQNPKSKLVRAFAKINLFLSVGPRDEAGYHPLKTVFQAVSLCDDVEVRLGAGNAVIFDVEGIPADNTVTKAIARYRRITNCPEVSVQVKKRIPHQAGLGGGSSDAAAVLWALQHLLGNPASPQQLAEIALEVGADVPFFLVGGKARAEGYGEILTPLPDEPEQWLVLAQPTERCPTKEMFRQLDVHPVTWRDFPDDDSTYNDFERVAPASCLDLIDQLRGAGAKAAGLSGSGSAVFGLFPSKAHATEAADNLKAPWVQVVRTLSRKESH